MLCWCHYRARREQLDLKDPLELTVERQVYILTVDLRLPKGLMLINCYQHFFYYYYFFTSQGSVNWIRAQLIVLHLLFGNIWNIWGFYFLLTNSFLDGCFPLEIWRFIWSFSLFHHRVLKVIEDLLEALETKETRYICRLWLMSLALICRSPSFLFVFKKRFIGILLSDKMTLLDFNNFPLYKQGHPGPPGHPGTPGSMGAPVSHYFGIICLFHEL